MTEVISFISGKGGVGKTTLVSNIGTSLAEIGKKVLVIDGNLSGANLGIHLGLSNFYPFSLNDVLRGYVSINHAVYRHYLGLDIIPASLTDIEVNPRRLKYVLKGVIGKKDYILIDSAAGIDNEVKAAVEASDRVVLITNPEVPAVVDALRAKALAERHKKEITGVILNKVRREKHELRKNEVEEMLSLPVIGEVTHHKKVRESIALRKPVVHHSPWSKPSLEIRKLAHILIGEEPPRHGLLYRLKGILKFNL